RTWVGPLRTRFELILERWALSRTDAVVTVSQGKTHFVRALDRAAGNKPYATIYNGFDADDLAGIEAARPKPDAERLLLLYTGRLYKHRRIDPLIESVGRLLVRGRVRRDELRIRMLGLIERRQRECIDRIVERYDLRDVVDIGGYVTRRDALAQQSGADALVLIVDPGETADGVLPGKITEYMGLGRFVLAVCPPGEARSILQRYGHAAWASADEPHRLDAMLANLIDRWRTDPASVTRRVDSAAVPTRRANAADMAHVLTRVAEASVQKKGSVTRRGAPTQRTPTVEC
ncbi:MAG TPA: glycosyltransferase, partial [Phycisphaerae bacterium]|nr:glycosyltransferase [Phycisphaerae bacterium]